MTSIPKLTSARFLIDKNYIRKNRIKWLIELLPVDYDDMQVIDLKGINCMSNIPDKSILITQYGSENVFVSNCHRRGRRYGLFILGDENLEDFIGYISSPLCIFVVCEYFNPLVFRNAQIANCLEKLLFIRTECSDEFFDVSKSTKPHDKELSWSFAGHVTGSGRGLVRKEAIETFSSLPGGYVLDTDQGAALPDDKKNEALTLTTKDYFLLLSRSYFTLCPMGWVINDTPRVYEALEAGSIPVLMKSYSQEIDESSYWDFIFPTQPPAPFVIAKSWDEALNICKELISSNKVHSLSLECKEYWINIKNIWRERIENYCLLLDSCTEQTFFPSIPSHTPF